MKTVKHQPVLVIRNLDTNRRMVMAHYPSIKKARECWEQYVVPAAKTMSRIAYILIDKGDGNKVLASLGI